MIHTGPAAKHLPDGRNAHLIQKPSEWWYDKVAEYFSIDEYQNGDRYNPKTGELSEHKAPSFIVKALQ